LVLSIVSGREFKYTALQAAAYLANTIEKENPT